MFRLSTFLLQTPSPQPELLFADDKVYTVMAVLLVIFAAMIGYLFMTNKKMKQLEQKLNELEENKN